MLNLAADAGDLDAIAAIGFAYSIGEIKSAMGALMVEEDRVKSAAAFLALARIRDNVEKVNLPAKYTDDGGLKISTERLKDSMNHEELSRLDKMESTYIKAYQTRTRDMPTFPEFLAELPEYACADVNKKP